MKVKLVLAIIFSISMLCVVGIMAKNNRHQKQGTINGAGLIGTYRIASDADGKLWSWAQTAIYRNKNQNMRWYLSASGYIGSKAPLSVEGSYEVKAKAIFPSSFTGQFKGPWTDGRNSSVSGQKIIPVPTIDNLEGYGFITGGNDTSETEIPW